MSGHHKRGCRVTLLRLMQIVASPLGLTGHTEVVRVVFSPQDISLEELLKHFWENHDPTQGSSAHIHSQTNQSCPQISPLPRGTGCIRAEG